MTMYENSEEDISFEILCPLVWVGPEIMNSFHKKTVDKSPEAFPIMNKRWVWKDESEVFGKGVSVVKGC